jgi:long-chain acyl-CoA synthetase
VLIDASMADLGARILEANPGVGVRVVVGGELPGWRRYEDALASAGPPPPVSDRSEMLYSSGTTGHPKAVRRPLPIDGKGSWAQKVLEYSLRERYGMTAKSVYLSPSPLYHAAGVNYTTAVHRVGAASILMRKFDAEAVLRLIETHRVTHAQFVPTMFVRMLKLPDAVRRSYDVSSLLCVIHAAAPCPVDVKHRMMQWFGPIIHEYYGGTEGFGGSIIGRPGGVARPPRFGRQAVHSRARRRR